MTLSIMVNQMYSDLGQCFVQKLSTKPNLFPCYTLFPVKEIIGKWRDNVYCKDEVQEEVHVLFFFNLSLMIDYLFSFYRCITLF